MWKNYFQILEKYFWDHIWNVGVICLWLDLVSNLTLEQKIWNLMILLYYVIPTKFLEYIWYCGCWVFLLLVYIIHPNYIYTCNRETQQPQYQIYSKNFVGTTKVSLNLISFAPKLN